MPARKYISLTGGGAGQIEQSVKGVMDYLSAINEDRIAEGRTDLVAAFSDFKDLVGFERFRELEKEYLPRFVE